ncbi:Thylakoid lumenal 17.4 kDa protein, chloroplastic [Porphyridium purpureum]|uniref:Thylakoid lumenal 17.4 kDa protein, chloroplastic n=1 Tax=Porphyridium purpureum TaxID=35688 RepID=A0A5J4YXE5_PORPP|nr:Thylakoid lumenal 17.4 kDa protein, chloroplastic [Porphyridium purpureum]|eukprot:POR8162..scf209_3
MAFQAAPSLARNERQTAHAAVSSKRAAVAVGAAVAVFLSTLNAQDVHALPPPKMPPINYADKKRCNPTSSAMGAANAARDTLLDLRECDLTKADLHGFDISGAFLESAKLDGANLEDVVMSKTYANRASFRGANFSNGVVDRVMFDNSDLTGAVFHNTVLSDSSFENAILENTDFSDAYIGLFGQRALCKNPTLKGENPSTGESTRESLGCGPAK